VGKKTMSNWGGGGECSAVGGVALAKQAPYLLFKNFNYRIVVAGTLIPTTEFHHRTHPNNNYADLTLYL